MRASEALLSGIIHDTEIISKSSQLRLYRRAQAAGLYLAFWGKNGGDYRLNVKIGEIYRHKTQLLEQTLS